MYKDILFTKEIKPDYIQDINDFMTDWYGPKSTVTVKTSGSTGIPKEIVLKKADMTLSAKNTGNFFGFKANQTLLLNLSPNYIAGKLMIIRAITFKMKILVAPLSENPLMALQDNIPIDFAAFVPYQIKSIVNHPESKNKYEKIKNVIIGGAPLGMEERRIISQLRNNSYGTFGMTETITHFALNRIENENDIYECLADFKVSQDERNCLVLGPNQMISKSIITNDVIDLIDDRKFRWLGRIDNVINSGGIKLHPEKLEQQLFENNCKDRFYFTKRKSDKFGEELILVIEGKDSYEKREVYAFAMKDWPSYQKPKTLIFLSKLKETQSGKIIRKVF
jgi:O-succinylbenzoic acid--CoA ligase